MKIYKRSLSYTILFLLQLAGCGNTQSDSDVILLPNGYIGWSRVDYGVKGAKPLVKKNGRFVYPIPTSGYLKTSSPPPQTMGSEDFAFAKAGSITKIDVDATIWGDTIGGPITEKQKAFTHRSFFVGTQAQSELADKFYDSVGPINPLALKAWETGKDLSYRELAGQNFSKANLVGANIRYSGLRGANLQKANLAYAVMQSDLTNANLQGANLHGVIFIEAVLLGANLRGCDLRKARLQGVDLSKTKLEGADLRGAEYDSKTKWPSGINAKKRGAIISFSVSQ